MVSRQAKSFRAFVHSLVQHGAQFVVCFVRREIKLVETANRNNVKSDKYNRKNEIICTAESNVTQRSALRDEPKDGLKDGSFRINFGFNDVTSKIKF